MAEKVDFFNTIAMGAIEDDIIVGAAGEESFHSPSATVDETDLTEMMDGLHLFSDGASDCGAKHRLKIHVEACFWCVESFFE